MERVERCQRRVQAIHKLPLGASVVQAQGTELMLKLGLPKKTRAVSRERLARPQRQDTELKVKLRLPGATTSLSSGYLSGPQEPGL